MRTEAPVQRRTNTVRRPPGIITEESAPSAPPRRSRWSRKKLSILAVLLVVAGIMIGRRETGPGPVNSIQPTAEEPHVVDCKVYPYKHHSKNLKDRLPDYKHLSLQAGINPIPDEKALLSLVSRGNAGLVEVVEDHTFAVAGMSHGRPYLTPKAYATLKDIAHDLHDRLKDTDLAGTRLKVTSLLRTLKDQKNLGRSNVNATRSTEAPHTHGTSFDISYMKFISPEGEQLELAGCQQVFLAETLAEVIEEHRRKDKLLFATREKQQACYHLTVCR